MAGNMDVFKTHDTECNGLPGAPYLADIPGEKSKALQRFVVVHCSMQLTTAQRMLQEGAARDRPRLLERGNLRGIAQLSSRHFLGVLPKR